MRQSIEHILLLNVQKCIKLIIEVLIMGSKASKTINIKPEEPKNSNKKEKVIE